ncbi:MAG: hypothetical protein HQ592_14215 [Planctomycetes bacterium]|nr:hypothetical protein [Planctomycetota bacterium]
MFVRSILVFLIVVGVASLCAAESSSASYVLERSVMGSAGGPASSASYSMNSTLGQSTPIGESSSASYGLGAGYWYDTIEAARLDGDADGNCFVNILDLILVRNNLGGNTLSDPVAAACDMDGNGFVNILDMLTVRNALGTWCE